MQEHLLLDELVMDLHRHVEFEEIQVEDLTTRSTFRLRHPGILVAAYPGFDSLQTQQTLNGVDPRCAMSIDVLVPVIAVGNISYTE